MSTGDSAVTGTETLVSATCGQVVTTPGDVGYDGAVRHTNNTAELTALLRAVQQENALDDGVSVQICSDSMYAVGIALGTWRLRAANRELARRLQVAYAKLRTSRAPGAVSIRHVRAHACIAGNETVDRLAKQAAQDERFAEDGLQVLQLATEEYLRTKQGDATPAQSAPPSAPLSTATAPSATFSPPVVAHSLGVG